jgi:hypothetical protein
VGEIAAVRLKAVKGLIPYMLKTGDHIANNGESLV